MHKERKAYSPFLLEGIQMRLNKKLAFNFAILLLCLIGFCFAMENSAMVLERLKNVTNVTEKLGVALTFAMMCIPIIGVIGMAILTALEICEEVRKWIKR